MDFQDTCISEKAQQMTGKEIEEEIWDEYFFRKRLEIESFRYVEEPMYDELFADEYIWYNLQSVWVDVDDEADENSFITFRIDSKI